MSVDQDGRASFVPNGSPGQAMLAEDAVHMVPENDTPMPPLYGIAKEERLQLDGGESGSIRISDA